MTRLPEEDASGASSDTRVRRRDRKGDRIGAFLEVQTLELVRGQSQRLCIRLVVLGV